jgi:hypothetical protein
MFWHYFSLPLKKKNMATQPGLIEALLAQLAEFTEPVTTAVMPAYGTDREVLSQFKKGVLKKKYL